MKQRTTSAELFSLVVGTGLDQTSLEAWQRRVFENFDRKRVAAAVSLGLPPTASWLDIMELRRLNHQFGSGATFGNGATLPNGAPPGSTGQPKPKTDRRNRDDVIETKTLQHV